MMLEALVHPSASFVTLTYDKEHLPENNSLQPRDLQLFMKRIRFNTGLPLRYFGVGEYGDHTQRPHYHLALFGLGPDSTDCVRKSWGMGHVYLGTLSYDSAAYVAGYVTKKMTAHDDPRLHGRYPEFARMSKRPGIGAHSIPDIAKALQSEAGWTAIEGSGDVPTSLRHGNKSYPLGPYLRRLLREAMNFENNKQPMEASLAQQKELQDLLSSYVEISKDEEANLKTAIVEGSRQKILRMETRSKIYSSKKGIGL